jgi:hypothetical protein
MSISRLSANGYPRQLRYDMVPCLECRRRREAMEETLVSRGTSYASQSTNEGFRALGILAGLVLVAGVTFAVVGLARWLTR